MALQTWAVLPVKPFDDAKSRLQDVLSAPQRRGLARGLMLQSLDALLECRAVERVVVITADPEAETLASERGALTLVEAGSGLNPALEQARLFAVERGATSLLVVAGDLPLLTSSDVDALVAAGLDSEVVIAPDRRREGTNALLLNPPDAIEFNFGESSFQRHLELAAAAGHTRFELKLSGFAFDIDLPEDWQDLQASGSLLRDAIRSGA
jgi:2-phospho-L-lactate/phosphoenolpyruvate guanylyltransferase